MATRRVRVEFIVDSKGAVKGVESYDKTVRMAAQTTKRAGKEVLNLGSIFNVALGNLAANAIAYAGRALRGLFSIVTDGVASSREADQTFRRLTGALENMGEEGEAAAARLHILAEEQQRLTGVSSEVIETAQAILLTFREVGGEEGAALLTSRMLDLAAGMSKTGGEVKDLNSVALLLGKTLVSSASQLRRMGISLTDAEAAAFDAAEGMDRVRLLAEIIDANVAGLAAKAADPFTIMSLAIEDTKQELGNELLPVLERLARRITAYADDPATIDFLRRIGELIAGIIEGSLSLLAKSKVIINTFVAGARGAMASFFRFVTNGIDILIRASDALGIDGLTAGLADLRAATLGYAYANEVASDAAERRAVSALKLAYGLDAVNEAQSKTPTIKPGGLPNVPTGGDEDAAKAAEKAAKEAEKARRDMIDKENELRALQIENMEEGSGKVIRQIGLEFDQRREAFRRRYGELTEEQEKLFTELENKAIRTGLAQFKPEDLPIVPTVEEINKLLGEDLIESISMVDNALGILHGRFSDASTEEEREEIEALIRKLEELRGKLSDVGEDSINIGDDIVEGLADATASLLESIGNLANGSDDFIDVGNNLVKALGDLAVKVGKMLIGFGFGALSLDALISNPFTAIAAGAALVALGSAAKAAVSEEVSKTTGGSDSPYTGISGSRKTPEQGSSIPLTFGGGAGGRGGDRGAMPGLGALEDIAKNGIRIYGESRTEGDAIVTTYDTAKNRRKKTIGG